MSQQELLISTAAFLDKSEIDYMVTGSIVSSLQGEPRATHDIDFVVQITRPQIKILALAFPEPKFYFDVDAANQAVANESMFNVIDTETGDKIDFWLLTNNEFDKSRFSRRVNQEYAGTNLKVPSPEDTIIMKLKWAKMSGGSEKQLNDAISVYEVQRGALDIAYIEKWIAELGLADLWAQLLSSAELG